MNRVKAFFWDTVFQAITLYVSWVSVHWTSLWFYNSYCVSDTWWGLIYDVAITSQMLHCQGVLWLLLHSHETVRNLIIAFGLWTISRIPKTYLG